jgi:hypothetical protein
LLPIPAISTATLSFGATGVPEIRRAPAQGSIAVALRSGVLNAVGSESGGIQTWGARWIAAEISRGPRSDSGST